MKLNANQLTAVLNQAGEEEVSFDCEGRFARVKHVLVNAHPVTGKVMVTVVLEHTEVS